MTRLARLVLAAYARLTIPMAPFAPLIIHSRRRRGKEDPVRSGERLGRPSAPRPPGPLIWFHAASLGEARAIMTVIRTVVATHADIAVLFTSGTLSSAQYLAEVTPPRVQHQFVPIDLAPAVRRFLKHWRPDMAIFVESELWPVLLLEAHHRQIPIALLNARISGPSFRRWQSVAWLARPIMALLTEVHAQNAGIGDQLLALGLPAERLRITGSLKQSSSRLEHDPATLAALGGAIDRRPVWLAASTHAGEEGIALQAHQRLRQTFPEILLVLVPRHPERAEEIERAFVDAGLATARRSAGVLPAADHAVYIADTFGEMGLWYRLARISLLGGSLVPVGGHNPWEPGLLHSAILHGPHVENFAEIYRDLGEAGASMPVRNSVEVAAAVEHLLDPRVLESMTEAAHRVVARPSQAINAATALIAEWLASIRPEA